MNDEKRQTLRYRILRYTPNLIRDEWVNIGVVLESVGGSRRAFKLIEEESELVRVRRLHPNTDSALLRSLPAEFEARFEASATELAQYLEKLEQTLSNAVQFAPAKAVLADDFDTELDRLYRDHVAPPVRTRKGIAESTRGWIKSRLNDVFRRRRVPQLQRNIRVEEFTHLGDPFKIDYGYANGVRGFIQTVTLGRDAPQAKILAYTAERIRAKLPKAEFTAITEVEAARDNLRHQFMLKLFDEQEIAIVPLNRVERFAEELRARLQ